MGFLKADIPEFIRKNELYNLSKVDLANVEKISSDLHGNELCKAAVNLSGSSAHQLMASCLAVLFEQNWMIIRELNDIKKHLIFNVQNQAINDDENKPDASQVKCNLCSQLINSQDTNCPNCGLDITSESISDEEFDNRILCHDGSCIGVIGSDGRCKVCGKIAP